MRIIAGSARGRIIAAPKGQDTRPTQDYVRESLFNILQRDIPEAHVLDLFAGSGALALEALSRGAADAVLSDHAADAIQAIQHNVQTLRFEEQAMVIRADWQAVLNRLSGEGRRFSLVFLDPPYRMTELTEQCERMADLGLLLDGALIVAEHRRDQTPVPDSRFAKRDERRYGDTVIHFFIYQEGGRTDA